MKLIQEEIRQDIATRISSIRSHMSRENIEATLVASNANIYYTTGRFFKGFVYIPMGSDPIWFIIKPDIFDKEDDVVIIRKPENIPGSLRSSVLSFPQQSVLNSTQCLIPTLSASKRCSPIPFRSMPHPR